MTFLLPSSLPSWTDVRPSLLDTVTSRQYIVGIGAMLALSFILGLFLAMFIDVLWSTYLEYTAYPLYPLARPLFVFGPDAGTCDTSPSPPSPAPSTAETTNTQSESPTDNAAPHHRRRSSISDLVNIISSSLPLPKTLPPLLLPSWLDQPVKSLIAPFAERVSDGYVSIAWGNSREFSLEDQARAWAAYEDFLLGRMLKLDSGRQPAGRVESWVDASGEVGLVRL